MSFVGHVKVCRIIFDSKSKYFSGIVRPNFDKYEDMDERRLEDMAYQYLCHLEEAKKWLEAVLHTSLPPSTVLEENLRNGVVLAKLGNFIAPDAVPLSKIYDPNQERFNKFGLQFRHTDNINKWIHSLEAVKLPKTFHPETTDVYDKKNMPRVIYCIHALSSHLFRLGKAPAMGDLYGKAYFTDDEINVMKKELQKVGVQMPFFQKIGGVLASEIPVDSAALHASVIAINEALDGQNTANVVAMLHNPAANLKNVIPENAVRYHSAMLEAKKIKIEATMNRSLGDSYTADAYDELLTQAEIQGHINSVNVLQAWDTVIGAVRNVDEPALFDALNAKPLELKAVDEKCICHYMKYMSDQFKNNDFDITLDSLKCRQILQNTITAGNKQTLKAALSMEAMWHVNKALKEKNPASTMKALQNTALKLEHLIVDAAPLYHQELKTDLAELKRDLTTREIQESVKFLTKIADVTVAVDMKNTDKMLEALHNLGTLDVDETLVDDYWRILHEMRTKKLIENKTCSWLTYFDIDDCVNETQAKVDLQNQMVNALCKLNKAVQKSSQKEVLSALEILSPAVGVQIKEHNARLYLRILQDVVNAPRREHAELWLSDAADALKLAEEECREADKACRTLVKIHVALMDNDEKELVTVLERAPFHEDTKVYQEYARDYMKLLIDCYKQKVAKRYNSSTIVYLTKKNHKAYINLKRKSFDWNPPETLESSPYLTLAEVEKLVVMLNDELAEEEEEDAADSSEACDGTAQLLMDCIILIQRWWRNILWRREIDRKTNARMERQKKNTDMNYFKRHERKIILLQSMWRGRQSRKMFQQLVHQANPTLSILRQFVSILSPCVDEFQKENEIQLLKAKIAKEIRQNQTLSQQLDDMDVKIGLLVQNRISLQDVQAHQLNLSDLAGHQKTVASEQMGSGTISSHPLGKGLKSLTKEGRLLLENYQNLFYLLQTQPRYLSKLLFCLPHSKSMHFLQEVIFSLFNFGSSKRDEYLLLKLLKSALEEEIRCKFKDPIDILKVYPQVLKIAVNFSRQHSGQNALREILGPLVQKVLNDKTIMFETNPIDIYTSWINKVEMTSGTASNLPRNVTVAEALEHEEVKSRLQKGITALQETVAVFLERICVAREQLPYSLLCTARTLHNALASRFPTFPEKDLLKVIGNVIYYHFINAAIVAPDAYDIITLPADKTLMADQRNNLASIAKILQYAASKKGFGDESSHLKVLNPFIIQCHEKFKKFLTACCEVEDLEDHFGVHAYSEATMIVKPTILISLQELWDTHQLVLQYEDDIAPKQADPLHSILENLGPLASVRNLLGGSSSDNFLPKGDITLTLSNSKLEMLSEQSFNSKSEPNHSQMFLMSKELLIVLLPYLRGTNLYSALDAPELPGENEHFIKEQQDLSNRLHTKNPNTNLHLSKRRLQLWLGKLEQQGHVSSSDNFQALLCAISKDICNRGQYCQARQKELTLLKSTLSSLEQKKQFHQKQVEFYNIYIKTCLESLDTGKKRVHQLRLSGQHPGKAKTQKPLKYTAAQLHSKGVLQKMQGLSPAQFKSVQFEISPTQTVGVFQVRGCFMGIPMESVEVDIQELLQMQYEGRVIMDIFGKATVNVNLMLFLLNKKFYGKS